MFEPTQSTMRSDSLIKRGQIPPPSPRKVTEAASLSGGVTLQDCAVRRGRQPDIRFILRGEGELAARGAENELLGHFAFGRLQEVRPAAMHGDQVVYVQLLQFGHDLIQV